MPRPAPPPPSARPSRHSRGPRQPRPSWSPRFEASERFFGLANQWAKSLRTHATHATPAKATAAFVRLHARDIVKNPDPELAIFWLMLAFYQCRDRCLQPLVRRRALAILKRGPEPVLWLDLSPSAPARRRRDYQKLLDLINRTPTTDR